MIIRKFSRSDEAWIKPIWIQGEKMGAFGAFFFMWSGLVQGRPKGVDAVVCQGKGFMRFVNKNGVCEVKEIIVAESARRQGVGRALLEELPRPIVLETNEWNESSLLFYKSLGFQQKGSRRTPKGKVLIQLVRK